MNRTIHTFCIVTTLLANSGLLFGMQKYSFVGKKPSLSLPTGNWEDADREDVAKNVALEREATAVIEKQKAFARANQSVVAKPTITITNAGTIPFIARTEDWFCEVLAGAKTLEQPCTDETFLEVLVGKKIGRFPADCLLNCDEETRQKKITVTILEYPENECVSAVLNDTLAITLEDAPPTVATHSRSNSLDNESDTTETTQPIDIDSLVVLPQSKSESYQGVVCANNAY